CGQATHWPPYSF
nr:immunoglobulin light chain junction region [Macaca mulatta]MOX08528.1 immunoglobulin light chain junction region [Macaca mulatta]MOX08694.1 immunoglobulin light chain junction region [Macaca mulatta]MOX09243.1 immunoglobulin light chain junction region [Macaca mulatta]MOX09360.1 immunoglobulin light chain junction region [Macaca mulatta]